MGQSGARRCSARRCMSCSCAPVVIWRWAGFGGRVSAGWFRRAGFGGLVSAGGFRQACVGGRVSSAGGFRRVVVGGRVSSGGCRRAGQAGVRRRGVTKRHYLRTQVTEATTRPTLHATPYLAPPTLHMGVKPRPPAKDAPSTTSSASPCPASASRAPLAPCPTPRPQCPRSLA